jgi:hypothetical protein
LPDIELAPVPNRLEEPDDDDDDIAEDDPEEIEVRVPNSVPSAVSPLPPLEGVPDPGLTHVMSQLSLIGWTPVMAVHPSTDAQG